MFLVGGPEQREVEGSRDVGDDDEDGGDTSKALEIARNMSV
jgi:hypothetical protein